MGWSLEERRGRIVDAAVQLATDRGIEHLTLRAAADVAAPARILKAFIKKAKKCEFKGGIVEKNILNAAQIEAIADLPSREVLIARMLGSMMSPISKFVIALNEIAKKQGGAEA